MCRTRPRLAALLAAAWFALASRAPRAESGPAAANAEGARLFGQGSVAEAVARFEEAFALDPSFEPARRNLAASLATLGHRRLQAGDLDGARPHLERAVELEPREAPYHILLGVLRFRRGDHYDARQSIDRALELDAELPDARELSGDLYYQEGFLSRARAEWEAALPKSARTAELRAKIERAAREEDAERGFGRDVSRHFTIQYDGPVPPEVARTALRLLEQAYDRLWRDFGRPPRHDVLVILYARGLFDELTRSPAWVAGTFDGKIRVPVGGLSSASDAERLGPILAHELTHAFIRANVPGRLPLWFEEGIAGHFQGTTASEARHTLQSAGGPFRSLEEVNAALRGGPRVDAAYAAAVLALAEMQRRDGFWLVRRVLERLADGRPFPESFEDAAGIPLEEFEQAWVESLR